MNEKNPSVSESLEVFKEKSIKFCVHGLPIHRSDMDFVEYMYYAAAKIYRALIGITQCAAEDSPWNIQKA